MSLDEAIELVLFAFNNAESGDIMVQKAPASTIGDLAQALKELFDVDNEIKTIGIRHGEKMYETLLTNEECAHAIDMGTFYRVPADKRDLNYDMFFIEGEKDRSELSEFNSNNTRLLSVEQIKEKLLQLDEIKAELNLWRNR
jgi:UDP-glucose 4-epimerase